MEIFSGVGCIAMALILWSTHWIHWLLLAIGVSSFMPWFGAAVLVRRAEADPERYPPPANEEERRARERRARIMAAVCVVVLGLPGAYLGYRYG
jgi:hypothetical protein